jgi:hypothetical protein
LAIVSALPVLAVLVGPGACSRKKEAAHIAEAGPENWVVDGAPYRILSTHYERRPSNVVVYVVRYPAPQGTSVEGLDQGGAAILAWPIVKYAYNNRTFARVQLPPEGSTPQSIILAIDVLSPDGGRLLYRHEVPAGK